MTVQRFGLMVIGVGLPRGALLIILFPNLLWGQIVRIQKCHIAPC